VALRSEGRRFLYVRRDLQRDVHPLVVSWGYAGDDPAFVARHERQGTRDPAAYLTVPAAIDWQRTRAWEDVRERCRALAAAAPARLGLEPLGPPGLQMVAMRLPDGAPNDLQERLYVEHRIEIPVDDGPAPRTIRASFQGYNDESDLDALAAALRELL
jgi:isopenicillin-N epimerase